MHSPYGTAPPLIGREQQLAILLLHLSTNSHDLQSCSSRLLANVVPTILEHVSTGLQLSHTCQQSLKSHLYDLIGEHGFKGASGAAVNFSSQEARVVAASQQLLLENLAKYSRGLEVALSSTAADNGQGGPPPDSLVKLAASLQAVLKAAGLAPPSTNGGTHASQGNGVLNGSPELSNNGHQPNRQLAISLSGSVGIGKASLALAAGGLMTNLPPVLGWRTIVNVDLRGVRYPEVACAMLLHAAQDGHAGCSLTQLCVWMQRQGRMGLILCNVDDLPADWLCHCLQLTLGSCPEVSLVLTSREPFLSRLPNLQRKVLHVEVAPLSPDSAWELFQQHCTQPDDLAQHLSSRCAGLPGLICMLAGAYPSRVPMPEQLIEQLQSLSAHGDSAAAAAVGVLVSCSVVSELPSDTGVVLEGLSCSALPWPIETALVTTQTILNDDAAVARFSVDSWRSGPGRQSTEQPSAVSVLSFLIQRKLLAAASGPFGEVLSVVPHVLQALEHMAGGMWPTDVAHLAMNAALMKSLIKMLTKASEHYMCGNVESSWQLTRAALPLFTDLCKDLRSTDGSERIIITLSGLVWSKWWYLRAVLPRSVLSNIAHTCKAHAQRRGFRPAAAVMALCSYAEAAAPTTAAEAAANLDLLSGNVASVFGSDSVTYAQALVMASGMEVACRQQQQPQSPKLEDEQPTDCSSVRAVERSTQALNILRNQLPDQVSTESVLVSEPALLSESTLNVLEHEALPSVAGLTGSASLLHMNIAARAWSALGVALALMQRIHLSAVAATECLHTWSTLTSKYTPETHSAHTLLAHNLSQLGCHAQAAAVLERALTGVETLWGAEHPQYLMAGARCAEQLLMSGRLEAAQKLVHTLGPLERRCACLSKPARATYLRVTAGVYAAQHKHSTACNLLHRALHILQEHEQPFANSSYQIASSASLGSQSKGARAANEPESMDASPWGLMAEVLLDLAAYYRRCFDFNRAHSLVEDAMQAASMDCEAGHEDVNIINNIFLLAEAQALGCHWHEAENTLASAVQSIRQLASSQTRDVSVPSASSSHATILTLKGHSPPSMEKAPPVILKNTAEVTLVQSVKALVSARTWEQMSLSSYSIPPSTTTTSLLTHTTPPSKSTSEHTGIDSVEPKSTRAGLHELEEELPLGLDPVVLQLWSRALALLAWVLRAQGKYKEAARKLQEAILCSKTLNSSSTQNKSPSLASTEYGNGVSKGIIHSEAHGMSPLLPRGLGTIFTSQDGVWPMNLLTQPTWSECAVLMHVQSVKCLEMSAQLEAALKLANMAVNLAEVQSPAILGVCKVARGRVMWHLGRLDEAQKEMLDGVSIVEQALGSSDRLVSHLLLEMSTLFMDVGKLGKAEKLLGRCREMQVAALSLARAKGDMDGGLDGNGSAQCQIALHCGVESLDLAHTESLIGRLSIMTCKPSAAMRHTAAAVELLETMLRSDCLLLWRARMTLGSTGLLAGRKAEALGILEPAVKALAKLLPRSCPEVTAAQAEMASALPHESAVQAESLLRAACRSLSDAAGHEGSPWDETLCRALCRLTQMVLARESGAEAQVLASWALNALRRMETHAQARGAHMPPSVQLLRVHAQHQLAHAREMAGQVVEAEDAYREALQGCSGLLEGVWGDVALLSGLDGQPACEEVAEIMGGLARSIMAPGAAPQESLELLRAAIELLSKGGMPAGPVMFTLLLDKAACHLGRPEDADVKSCREAEALSWRALEIAEAGNAATGASSKASNERCLLQALQLLVRSTLASARAVVAESNGQISAALVSKSERALAHAERALDLAGELYGDHHPATAGIQGQAATLLGHCLGRTEEAGIAYRIALEIYDALSRKHPSHGTPVAALWLAAGWCRLLLRSGLFSEALLFGLKRLEYAGVRLQGGAREDGGHGRDQKHPALLLLLQLVAQAASSVGKATCNDLNEAQRMAARAVETDVLSVLTNYEQSGASVIHIKQESRLLAGFRGEEIGLADWTLSGW